MSGSRWDVLKEARLGIGIGSCSTGSPDAGSLRSDAPGSYPNRQFLVQFDLGADAATQAAVLESVGGRLVEVVREENVHDGTGPLVAIEIGAGVSPQSSVEALTQIPGVTFAEPDWEVTIDAANNDPARPDNGLPGTYDDAPVTNPQVNHAGTAGPHGNMGHNHGSVEVARHTSAPDGPVSRSKTEPSPDVHIDAVSNDPGYTNGNLWGMYGDTTPVKNAYGSQAGEAWTDGYTGTSKSIVGVVDTGIDYTHPDLYLNVWLNQREIPTVLRSVLTDVDADGLITFRDLNNSANAAWVADKNNNGRIDAGDLLNDVRWENGRDEEANGYLDDLIGWDFVNNDNDPYDDQGHGTHVSGTIGAVGGNGAGVAGVNWNVQIAGLKFLSASGSGNISNAIKAIDYFTDAASRATTAENFVATNNSWGGGGYSQALLGAIERGAQRDILFIAAAGNNGSNNDTITRYPSNYSTTAVAGYDAVVSVASLDSTGVLSNFSNYGAGTVDLAAPGASIYSTLRGGGYGYMSGTSMATPHVTGAAALYASAHPEASAAEIRAALLGSVASTTSLQGKSLTGGRLDIGALMGKDTTAPTATITLADKALKAGETSLVTIVFSEQVTELANNDLTVENGTLSTIASTDGGKTWNGIFTPTANIEDATNVIRLAATYTDLAGNAGTAATSANYTVDTTAPTAAIALADTALKKGETSLVTIAFSEQVTGLTKKDLTVENGTLSTIASNDGGKTWNGIFTPTANLQDATNVIRLAATYTDLAGNAGTAAISDNYTVDTKAPTATITLADKALKAGETSLVTIAFSEQVTELANNDLTVENGALSTIASTDDGKTWNGLFTPTANIEDATNVIRLAATYTDLADNAGTTATSANYTIDTKASNINMVTGDDKIDVFEQGSGIDTIKIAGSGISIDLTGNGNNALKLALQDVLDLGGMNVFNNGNGWTDPTYNLAAGGANGSNPERRHQLVVDGDAGDAVNAAGWTNAGTVNTGGHTYEVYNATSSSVMAQLLVDTQVTRTGITA